MAKVNYTHARDKEDYPTPMWATRALFTHVLIKDMSEFTCLEPACNRGFMAEILKEYFGKVFSYDKYSYGYGKKRDFLSSDEFDKVDWTITNPPYLHAESFVFKALRISDQGVAVFVRTDFIESAGRYQRLFSKTPPTIVAQFTERVNVMKGGLVKKLSSPTPYSWIVWKKNSKVKNTRLVWIPPCRKELELLSDYT